MITTVVTVPGIEGIRTELKNFANTYVDDDLTTKLVGVQTEVKASRVGIDRLSADVRGLTKAVTEGQQQLDVTLKSIGAQIVEALQGSTEEPLHDPAATQAGNRDLRHRPRPVAHGHRRRRRRAAAGPSAKRKSLFRLTSSSRAS